jgi:hypothetical protein
MEKGNPMLHFALSGRIVRIPALVFVISLIAMACAGSSGFSFVSGSRSYAAPLAEATPSPEIEAELSGAPINGLVPKGEAEFEVQASGNREFGVRVENVNLATGTLLDVFVDGTKVGTITLVGNFERSELQLKTELGQQIPQISTRTRVVVATQAGVTVVAGSFSNLAPNPSPTPAPSQSPTSNGEVRIEAKLAGAAINGLRPVGEAKFKVSGSDRELEVEVERLNLPANTMFTVFIDNVKVGDLVLGPTMEAKLQFESERGQTVPNVITRSTVVVANSQGQTVLSGVFNTVEEISKANDIDDSSFFVEQQYRDFLGREADDNGLDFWRAGINACGDDAACSQPMRVNTSAAFFLSIEFQQTGYLLYRLNKASFGSMPRRNEFMIDMQSLATGVIVGTSGWQQTLEDNTRRMADEWVQRPAFRDRFGSQNDDQYVRSLFFNAGIGSNESEINDLVQALTQGRETRATVLRHIADDAAFVRKEQNPAFVLMQYFGYLHRNPDEGPDTNLDGFLFWLRKLDDANGDFQKAEMVRAFIESTEYRNRFDW